MFIQYTCYSCQLGCGKNIITIKSFGSERKQNFEQAVIGRCHLNFQITLISLDLILLFV